VVHKKRSPQRSCEKKVRNAGNAQQHRVCRAYLWIGTEMLGKSLSSPDDAIHACGFALTMLGAQTFRSMILRVLPVSSANARTTASRLPNPAIASGGGCHILVHQVSAGGECIPGRPAALHWASRERCRTGPKRPERGISMRPDSHDHGNVGSQRDKSRLCSFLWCPDINKCWISPRVKCVLLALAWRLRRQSWQKMSSIPPCASVQLHDIRTILFQNAVGNVHRILSSPYGLFGLRDGSLHQARTLHRLG
jgi:hypothetical protein